MKFDKPVGFFLCGGGALGAWQSGVLLGLVENGVKADAIAGFSIGALNSAFYCFDEVGRLRDVWSKVNNKYILRPSVKYHNVAVRFHEMYNTSFIQKIRNKLEQQFLRMSMFSNEPIYEMLDSFVPEKVEFKNKVKFFCISHCVETRLPYIKVFDENIDKKTFITNLVASCSIPFVFPPIELTEEGRKKHLVDGGVIGVATINLNILEGCKTIFMISNSSDYEMNNYLKIKSKIPLLGSIEKKSRRILAYHNYKIYESKEFVLSKPQVYFIRPEVPINLSILDFKGEKCVELFDRGREFINKFLSNI